MEYMEETALKKEPEITVLKVEPGKAPEEVTIPNTLEAMQQMVGGLIEIVYLTASVWCATRRASSWGWRQPPGRARHHLRYVFPGGGYRLR